MSLSTNFENSRTTELRRSTCYIQTGMKTSPTKAESNRRNAQRSTGPKSAQGKAASSRNALRHGLSTMTLTVLPTEDLQDLEDLREPMSNEWNPIGDAETFLVY